MVQKRVQRGSKKDIQSVNEVLAEWVNEFTIETIRSLRGVGKYRLAPGYDQFFVEPSKWNMWGVDRREQHINAFMKFIPKESDCYTKPKSAGLKKMPREKRRSEMCEPDCFVDRIQVQPPICQVQVSSSQPKVSPIKIARLRTAGLTDYSVIPRPTPTLRRSSTPERPTTPVIPRRPAAAPRRPAATPNRPAATPSRPAAIPTRPASINVNGGFDPLNPNRILQKEFYLVHRQDTKNCPRKVKRCHSCKRLFCEVDWVVVKTDGAREYTNEKTGKQVTYHGNIYIHYLNACLSEYQQNFSFAMVKVLPSTLSLLPNTAEQRFRDMGCQFV